MEVVYFPPFSDTVLLSMHVTISTLQQTNTSVNNQSSKLCLEAKNPSKSPAASVEFTPGGDVLRPALLGEALGLRSLAGPLRAKENDLHRFFKNPS